MAIQFTVTFQNNRHGFSSFFVVVCSGFFYLGWEIWFSSIYFFLVERSYSSWIQSRGPLRLIDNGLQLKFRYSLLTYLGKIPKQGAFPLELDFLGYFQFLIKMAILLGMLVTGRGGLGVRP